MSLARYTVRRILQGIPVLIGVATITFFLSNAIPGNPVDIMLGPSPSQQQAAAIRAKFGLDKPLWVRYVNYIGDVSPIWLTTTASFPFVEPRFGVDLGQSIYYWPTSVTEKIMQRLPATLLLLVSTFTFAIPTAVGLGVLSADRRNEPTDHVARVLSLIGVSTPSFWIGLMLILAFSFHFNILPATGLVMPWADPVSVGMQTQVGVIFLSIKHLIMPTLGLGTLQMASITRIERSAMLENLQKDYVRLARAYGVKEETILRKHAFRPSQLPVITIVGLNLTAALGGAVLTETVFEINGIGRLIVGAISRQDYPLIMGTTLFFGVIFVVGVIITDISYAYVDPRVSYGEEEA
jgi:peptide/nickel transport system permease protein